MKYKSGDIVIIYKNTPTYEEGGIAQVIDRDPNDRSYAVALLQQVGEANYDTFTLLKEYVKWVSEDSLGEVSYNKPRSVKKAIYGLIQRSLAWMRSLRIGLLGR